jgi:hypothetical protein
MASRHSPFSLAIFISYHALRRANEICFISVFKLLFLFAYGTSFVFLQMSLCLTYCTEKVVNMRNLTVFNNQDISTFDLIFCLA